MWWEIKGVPKPLLEDQSKRSMSIRKAAGGSLKELDARLIAEIKKTTRPRAERRDRDEQEEDWRATGERFDFDPQVAASLCGRTRVKDQEKELAEALSRATLRLQDKAITERELIHALCEECQARGVSAEKICLAAETQLRTRARELTPYRNEMRYALEPERTREPSRPPIPQRERDQEYELER